MKISNELLEFATPRQREIAEAVISCNGSLSEAAELLGINSSNVTRAIQNIQLRAARQGYSPEHDMTRTAPKGFSVQGTSTLYDSDGTPKIQWVKTKKDATERTLEALEEAVEGLISPVKGKARPRPIDTLRSDDQLMCVYPIADVHCGMYAYGKETGTDMDTDIISDILYSSMESLVISAPPAKTALIANLGDYFHADTQENKTLRSGHQLDVDTRWSRVLQIGIKTYRNLIDLALTKHDKVIVKSAKGNHDDHTIFVLAVTMKAYFENEPRVEIHLPINPFSYHTFGNTLLGLTHGLKADRLPGIMACDMREEWGKTRFHHWLTGHIHHQTFSEFPGCTVESVRSPTAKDSWTNSMGYRSDRDMQVITYHHEFGEVSRNRVSIY